jgi:DAK2 domain fusion protein YloV
VPARDAAPVQVSVLREPLRAVGGAQVLGGLKSALSWLQANQQEVNDLNVFPVPDGDTGSNMYLTLRSAVEEAQEAPNPEWADSVLASAAHGSLMGARGNSGVILSQILRGFAQGVSGKQRLDVHSVARAFREASNVAYRAVIKPTEGTILTVIREAADAAGAAAEESEDIRVQLERVVRESHAAVERTVDQLQVLREAGVVDAGGFGLAVALEGFSRAVNETSAAPVGDMAPHRAVEPLVRSPELGPPSNSEVSVAGHRRGAAAVAAREEGWGYCTEFVINGPNLDVDGVRDELGGLGESALVVGDSELIRVHIHTEHPAALIAAASRRGSLTKLKVEDMTAQHHEVLERAAVSEQAAVSEHAAAQHKPVGVVSVAPAGGFGEILQSLGADRVVLGGPTMNPSIEDLLMAVKGANADTVILLPNNENVILTAEHVDEVAGDDVGVRVVPTRNLPQGISALLAFDASAGADGNVERMTAALRSVRSVEVTRAVRDTTSNGREIREGNVIAIVDGDIRAVGDDYHAVIGSVLAEQPSSPELVTVYRGSEVSDGEAEQMVSFLRAEHPGTEFELHNGGQEHYPYVLSLE